MKLQLAPALIQLIVGLIVLVMVELAHALATLSIWLERQNLLRSTIQEMLCVVLQYSLILIQVVQIQRNANARLTLFHQLVETALTRRITVESLNQTLRFGQ
jgi:hypothetical protein